MPKKLAVVISGAVSLGSYEAGVMYEILEAIARHNEDIKNHEEPIEIDVITGASAGGMTACILVQHLLCGDQPAPFTKTI
jgi:predicted acylesterase/phospholipase RssA